MHLLNLIVFTDLFMLHIHPVCLWFCHIFSLLSWAVSWVWGGKLPSDAALPGRKIKLHGNKNLRRRRVKVLNPERLASSEYHHVKAGSPTIVQHCRGLLQTISRADRVRDREYTLDRSWVHPRVHTSFYCSHRMLPLLFQAELNKNI